MNEHPTKIKIAISIGDYNGIGPEVILKSLAEKEITDFFTPIIFASTKLLNFHKDILKLDRIYLQGIPHASKAVEGKINVVNLWKNPIETHFGQSTKEAGEYAYQSLKAAAEAVLEGHADVLVTAPFNKDNIQSEIFQFPGHTEYLGKVWGGSPLMFMVSDDIKVGLVTQHVPLQEVVHNITPKSVEEKIKQIQNSLIRDFGIEKPKIAVLGLNPHAGDNGLLGKEEQEILLPIIDKKREQGHIVLGPYPADSFFTPHNLHAFDAVLAMYHDQGLTPFKTIAFEEGVNFTAGLPFVRTSPDHGVAYDIAGKGIANQASFREALFMAVEIYRKRNEYEVLTKNVLKPMKIKVEKGDESE
ncbi:4-hydroxythreonine-4-phosphate dehydrogenase PdxA [uncultured Weeksella sp.]|uniref:4-hydroxythreonine-4-phosphate dehydrogenase PdxA n=1 Tax=uncultured Weeksella sp. TaxID=1161389 RepID=UPI00259B3E1D|nr:4-hydroxythreonine-4-phosphate dehydrogenase PdxA [uncultured Weeksella sp.]